MSMPPDLAVPAHLAVNLLGLFAAAGLALAIRHRADGDTPASPRPVSESLVVWGAAAIAAAHALDGSFLADRAGTVRWLISGGLVSVAAGLSPARVRALRREPYPAAVAGWSVVSPALVLPATAPVAWVGLAAGLLGAARAVAAGGNVRLLGLGLALWGAAQPIATVQPRLGAAVTVGGAVAVACWVWTVSADRLQAKFVTAFVAALLVVVVLAAAVLSTLGAAALEREELGVLSSASAEIAHEVGASWPRQAVERLSVLAGSGDTLDRLVEQADTDGLRNLLVSVLGQDVLAVLDRHGDLLLSTAEVDALAQQPFLRALGESETVSRLVDGQREAGELLMVATHVVALGGIGVFGQDTRPEDPPRFIVVTGRVADAVWANQAAARQPFDVALEAGGELRAVSAGLMPATAARPLDELGEAAAAAVPTEHGLLFVASAPLADPVTLEPLGRVLTVRSGEALERLERDQARQLFLITLAAIAVTGLIGAVTSGWLVAPLRRLTEAATAVGEGRLDVQARLASRDEVGRLGRAFDGMTASLAAQSSRLRQAADEQARLRARLQALYASMSDALVAVDREGDVVTVNAAAERLLGRDSAAVTGLPLQEMLIGRTADGRRAARALGPPDGELPTTARLLLEGAGARVVPVAATAAPVRENGGEVLGRVFVLRDVTREAAVEHMKEEFLANVSHELRTPLTPIKGYADVLARRDVDDASRRRFAGEILSSTARLERIVAMIVEFAAFDAGEKRPEIEPADVPSVVKEVLDRWQAQVRERSFSCALGDDLPPVLVDVAMLRRCLDELLDNAVKFSPGGEPVAVTARCVDEADHATRVRLSVIDRGVGIEPTRLGELFGDFYQGDASATRLFGGLGLGLALVQRMVTAMGADAAVESEVGDGAAFHLYLPVATPGDDSRDDPDPADSSRP